jgi:hypothetical protein
VSNQEELNLEEYSSEEARDLNMPVPLFLKVTYVVVLAVCIFWAVYFWGGSRGYFDRGRWRQLEVAAQTTTPE